MNTEIDPTTQTTQTTSKLDCLVQKLALYDWLQELVEAEVQKFEDIGIGRNIYLCNTVEYAGAPKVSGITRDSMLADIQDSGGANEGCVPFFDIADDVYPQQKQYYLENLRRWFWLDWRKLELEEDIAQEQKDLKLVAELKSAGFPEF